MGFRELGTLSAESPLELTAGHSSQDSAEATGAQTPPTSQSSFNIEALMGVGGGILLYDYIWKF